MDALVQLGALLTAGQDSVSDSIFSSLGALLQRDPSPVVRALAARTLELAHDPRAVPHLISAVEPEQQVAVRKAIIYALARYPSSQVTETLTALLNGKKIGKKISKKDEDEIRSAAALALAEVGDSSAVSALLEVLTRRRREEESFARSQAARGLGRIADRRALDPLLIALTHDKSMAVQREAARALGLIATDQDTKVLEALRAAALADDPYLAAAADNALNSITLRAKKE